MPRWTPLLALSAALAPGLARADDPAPAGRLTLATERVVVFKDGHGLFVKRASGTADAAGRVFTTEVPDTAVLGTFWAVADEGRILAMEAGWTERREVREKEVPCLTVLELLRANLGREVTLGLTREGAAALAGTVAEVLDLSPEPTPPTESPAGPAGEFVRPLEPQGGAVVLLGTADGQVALPVAEVRTVTGSALVTKRTRREEVTTREKRLSFDLGPAAAGNEAHLRVLYFRPGVRWIPTYRLAGDLQAEGNLALQAEILNEAEDFDGAAVDLVVGVPHFRFQDAVSPLVLEGAVRQVLAQQERDLLGQQWANNRLSNDFAVAAPPDATGGILDLAPDLAAAQGHDLFVYGVPRLAMRRGSRTTVPLWQAKAPLRHLYTYEVSLQRDARSGSRLDPEETGERASPLRLSRNEVWHQVEIPNGTEVPWTTGSALLLKGDLPLVQDILVYTPRGGRALLPVTAAVDVRGTYAEEETGRKPDALRWDGHMYTLVTKRASITVTNHKREPASLRVTLSGGGRARAASDGATVVLDDYRPDDWRSGNFGPVNNHSTATWEFTVEPSATRTVTLDFEFFVR
jgi:hypothetical protein